MSRRPLPRTDPLATPGTFSGPGGFPSRPPVSPFSETVRILNRRVKPREVKRGRIILNLKVIDKPGSGGGGRGMANRRAPTGSMSFHGGRQNLPSRNRIIGKRSGEAPYRPFQPMLGFPMYGKPFGLQCGSPGPLHSLQPATGTSSVLSGAKSRDTQSTPSSVGVGCGGSQSIPAQNQPTSSGPQTKLPAGSDTNTTKMRVMLLTFPLLRKAKGSFGGSGGVRSGDCPRRAPPPLAPTQYPAQQPPTPPGYLPKGTLTGTRRWRQAAPT
ncbi:hypothetical protein UPYG_G00062610 [Umbra pygmaea]|uniref:Uncharacterized protein n=1 Tax=Umbra pygmaea TaxID=75934 RepID=A0ABD0XCQ9_UMBPY